MSELNHHNTQNQLLLIGIGNSGRSDDGLGWAFVETMAQNEAFTGDTLLRYQLQIEDAAQISEYKQVIFVDAHQGKLKKGFSFNQCSASNDFSFTTHRLAPGTVLHLCRELYEQNPSAYLLLIDGENWELDIGLSQKAQQNLQNALVFFTQLFTNHSLTENA